MRWLPFVLVVACGNPNYPPELPLDPVYTTCEITEDCVVIELGCCDACNGGTAVGVNKDAAKDVEETFSESCGKGYACSLMGCPPMQVSCVDTVCVAEPGEWSYDTTTTVSESTP